jgi:hypothetical protein
MKYADMGYFDLSAEYSAIIQSVKGFHEILNLIESQATHGKIS